MTDDQIMEGFPESVERRLAADDAGFARSARHLLPPLEQLPLTPPYEQLLHAILDLADGDWELVRHYSQQVRQDWRDVLLWASGSS